MSGTSKQTAQAAFFRGLRRLNKPFKLSKSQLGQTGIITEDLTCADKFHAPQEMDRIINGEWFKWSNVCRVQERFVPPNITTKQYWDEYRPVVKFCCVFCNEFAALTQSAATFKEYLVTGKKVVKDAGLRFDELF